MSDHLTKLGKLLHSHSLQQFKKYGLDRQFTTSQEVFERFVVGLLDGMIKVELLDRARPVLFSKMTEQEAVKHYGAGSDRQFKDWIFQSFRDAKIGGLFKWELIGDGIIGIMKLARSASGLINLYPMLARQSEVYVARHELLRRLLDIPGISDKKALVLLRDLHYQCSWGYPLEGLPMPIDTHIQVVMRRMGYVKGQKKNASNLEIQSAARVYFQIPIVVDLAIWDIGKRFCPKRGQVNCRECVASQYCERQGIA